ncbi:MAG: hypothetical protein E7L17_14525 [Clostridium sp.]|uniref:hypothetical protein n=1 Tax=Clostridium sp. TaxID=1506 RepID=UPI002908398E|nr:hypothetical protein [Clostridium sp.]MDU7339315.1 hypothetical protein [Clostridium sp.]
MKSKIHAGEAFGRLTVIKREDNDNRGKTKWLCHCSCGKEKVILADSLISGKTKSCGCLRAEVSNKNAKATHGMSGSRLWVIWCGMKSRCSNPKNIAFKNYGAIGIKVCDLWRVNFLEFYNWSMQNGYKEHLTIDRINTSGNYEPDNCRWATYEQQENNRRNTVYFTACGNKLPVSEWSRRIGISSSTLRWRIEKGWNENEILMPTSYNNKNIRRKI